MQALPPLPEASGQTALPALMQAGSFAPGMALPPVASPPLPAGAYPSMAALPAMPAMELLPPVSFLQEGEQDMSGVFQSTVAIPGCGCNCDAKQEAMIKANQNALALAAFPEDGEPLPWSPEVPWGHGA